MMNIQTARRALLEKHFSTSQNAKFVEQVSTKIQTTKQVYHAHPVLEPTLPTMKKPTPNMMNFQTARHALLEKHLSTLLQNVAFVVRGSTKNQATN